MGHSRYDSRPLASSGSDTISYRPDIDGLRAIAVLAVLLFHLEVPGFEGGYVGVDIFFVISGFLITRNIATRHRLGRWSFADFYGRRCRRLFPALFAILCLSFAFSFLLLTPKDFEEFAQSLLYTTVLAPNVFFWLTSGYFQTEAQFRPLLHLWSLGIEEQFYLLWPALLIPLLRLSNRRRCAVILLLVLVSAGLGQHRLGIDAEASFYLVPFRASGLAAGALLFFLGEGFRGSVRLRNGGLLIGLGAIAFSIARFGPTTSYPGMASLVPVLGAALVIGAGRTTGLGRLLANPPAVRIGLASYSLYLIHWPLLVFYKYWTLRPLVPLERVAVGAVSVAAALAMWRWIEQPFRFGDRNRLSPAGFACACTALALALAFPAANVWARGGLTWRVPGYNQIQASIRQEAPLRCRKGRMYPGCVFGARKPTPEDILVIGDSHATALFPAFDWLARQHGLKVRGWTYRACPPLFDALVVKQNPAAKPFEAPCRKLVKRWERFVLERRPPIVVLAARWAAYTEPTNGYGLISIPGHLLIDADTRVQNRASSREVLARELPRTVAEITRLGSKVIVFGQPPVLGVSSTRCRLVPTYLLGEDERERRCLMVSYEQMTDRLRFADEIIARLASDQVMTVQTKDVFCNDVAQRCRFFRDGKTLYRDHHHLNRLGSLEVARYIEGRFASFVAR